MNDSEANIMAGRGQAANLTGELRVVAIETHVLTRMLMKSAKRDLERRLEASGVDVGALAYRVMRFLDRHTSTLADLSRTMGIGAAALVPVIDALETKGFVKRGRDPKDRRRNPLTVTPAGRNVLAQVPAIGEDDSLVRGLAALGSERSRQLLEILRELVANVSGDEAAVSELSARLASHAEAQQTAPAKPQGV